MAESALAENDPIESKLLEMAQGADSGAIDANEVESVIPDAAPSEELPAADELAGDTKADDQPADPKTDQPGTEPAKADDATPADGESDSPYTKARKEQERYDRNWKKFQEEKAAFEAERAELARLRAERQPANPAEISNEAKPPKDANGYTAADYEAAAKDFEREGEVELAAKARETAAALAGHEAQARTQQQQAEFQRTWREHLDATVREIPELKDASTPLGQKVMELLKTDPAYGQLPDGFARAAKVAKAQLEAGSVPGLQSRVQELEKQLQAANARAGVGGINPARPVEQKTFAQKSQVEQERELLAAAAELDAAGVPVLR